MVLASCGWYVATKPTLPLFDSESVPAESIQALVLGNNYRSNVGSAFQTWRYNDELWLRLRNEVEHSKRLKVDVATLTHEKRNIAEQLSYCLHVLEYIQSNT